MATLSLIGADTQLGRETADGLKRANLNASVQLMSGDASLLADSEGEALVMSAIDERVVLASDLIVSAADPTIAAKVWAFAGENGPPMIDINGSLEAQPSARIRSPLTEPDGYYAGRSKLSVIAQPAATVLALLLRRIHAAFPIRHTVAQVFEPASERGLAGIQELQQQVTSLLSFRPLEKKVFDAQIGFNLLPRYGEDAPESLAEVEARIVRHLVSLLAAGVPIPSLRLIQAPVFHGYTLSLWIEFDTRPSRTALEEAIATAQIDVRGEDVEPPTNVGVAGQSGVTAGMVEIDRNHPSAAWLFAAADNYQIAADNAVALARSILGEKGR
jgi:aspartate-semialdehyde dehydrogenase